MNPLKCVCILILFGFPCLAIIRHPSNDKHVANQKIFLPIHSHTIPRTRLRHKRIVLTSWGEILHIQEFSNGYVDHTESTVYSLQELTDLVMEHFHDAMLAHDKSLYVFPLAPGGLALEYQHPVTPFLRFMVPLDTHTASLSFLPHISILTGIGAMFHYRDWYVEPGIKFGYGQIVYPAALSGNERFFQLRPGALLGYQTILESGLLMRIGVGLEWRLFFPHESLTHALAGDVILVLGYAF